MSFQIANSFRAEVVDSINERLNGSVAMEMKLGMGLSYRKWDTMTKYLTKDFNRETETWEVYKVRFSWYYLLYSLQILIMTSFSIFAH